jgi:hypothetical protein
LPSQQSQFLQTDNIISTRTTRAETLEQSKFNIEIKKKLLKIFFYQIKLKLKKKSCVGVCVDGELILRVFFFSYFFPLS